MYQHRWVAQFILYIIESKLEGGDFKDEGDEG